MKRPAAAVRQTAVRTADQPLVLVQDLLVHAGMTVTNVNAPLKFDSALPPARVEQTPADAVDTADEVDGVSPSASTDSVVAASADNEIGAQLDQSPDDKPSIPHDLDRAPAPRDPQAKEGDELGAIAWGPRQRPTIGAIGIPNSPVPTSIDAPDSEGA